MLIPLPIGTSVVTRAAAPGRPVGAVGSIVSAPETGDGVYVVRFGDGGEAEFRREELGIRKHIRREGFEGPDSETDESLWETIIYRCVVGSRAYGLDSAASDTDRRGIFLPPAERHWSLRGVPEQIERKESEECYWELEKFLGLALKANPNVLECLYSPLVEETTPIANELLGLKEIFLSRLVYQTYNGYVMSQFKKLEQDLRTRGEIREKHAMHLIRLLLSGITILRDGFVPVRVEEHRDRLLAIKTGDMPWDEVNRWRLDLHRAFDAAFAATKLPERPNFEAADRFLIRSRRAMV
jgi:predicted nucleotidyltransferase